MMKPERDVKGRAPSLTWRWIQTQQGIHATLWAVVLLKNGAWRMSFAGVFQGDPYNVLGDARYEAQMRYIHREDDQ